MEPLLRGIVEKCIDEILKTESLNDLRNTIEDFKPFIKSKEDAMFGFIISYIRVSASLYSWSLYRRLLTLEENIELTRMTHEQAIRIRSRILETLK